MVRRAASIVLGERRFGERSNTPRSYNSGCSYASCEINVPIFFLKCEKEIGLTAGNQSDDLILIGLGCVVFTLC